MNCYQCAASGDERAAVAVCLNCGAGLCVDHLAEAQSYRIGGTTFGCPHDLAAAASRPKP
jgi:hypothetical protein